MRTAGVASDGRLLASLGGGDGINTLTGLLLGLEAVVGVECIKEGELNTKDGAVPGRGSVLVVLASMGVNNCIGLLIPAVIWVEVV